MSARTQPVRPSIQSPHLRLLAAADRRDVASRCWCRKLPNGVTTPILAPGCNGWIAAIGCVRSYSNGKRTVISGHFHTDTCTADGLLVYKTAALPLSWADLPTRSGTYRDAPGWILNAGTGSVISGLRMFRLRSWCSFKLVGQRGYHKLHRCGYKAGTVWRGRAGEDRNHVASDNRC
jgi:hypothetical protein